MEKETIIFLHGIVGNRNAFKREMEVLQAHYHCISYDLYDPKLEGQFSLEQLIEQLYRIYTKAKINRAHLCSLSFGCIIAKGFARKYPEMVLSMTFVGGYCCKVPSLFDQKLTKVLAIKDRYEYVEWIKLYARLFNPNIPFIAEDSAAIFLNYALQVHPLALEKAIFLQREFDSSAALVTMKMPILWVMGEWDELYKSTLRDLSQFIPHVHYIELKNAGHVAHIHQPEPFMAIFQSFLNYSFIKHSDTAV
ncbi:alpha/beta fold hydrolase [Alkalihalophilus sp. As8PL]|uniref:Alpha/beta fold hydrolase n=1 Tax=Alkalihalophilus sp. As8PL TaxID=3237103 RepID=A0AB39BPB1_9BACI